MKYRHRYRCDPKTLANKRMFEHRRMVLAAALALFLPTPAVAELTGHKKFRAALAGKSDQVLVAANPELERIARENPELLHEVLRRLRESTFSYSRALTQARPKPASAAESAILAENPDLGEFYRESPEAALDLLRLIREAAKRQ